MESRFRHGKRLDDGRRRPAGGLARMDEDVQRLLSNGSDQCGARPASDRIVELKMETALIPWMEGKICFIHAEVSA